MDENNLKFNLNVLNKILDYAIKNEISVRKACKILGYGEFKFKGLKERMLKNKSFIKTKECQEFIDKHKSYLDGLKESLGSEVLKKNIVLTKKPNGESEIVADLSVKVGDKNVKFGYQDDHIVDIKGLLNKCNISLNEWEVVDSVVNKWDVTSFKRDGLPITWQNFQVKIRIKPIKEVEESNIVRETIYDIIENYKKTNKFSNKTILPNFPKNRAEKNLLEINLFDLHIGKLAWSGETGENYDVSIAKERFEKILEDLLMRSNGFVFERILFPIGNDFFNSDNLNNTTTAGTPQHEDLRWQKTFKIGVELLIYAIERLKSSGLPVDVLIIPGNHDFERSYYMGCVIEAWFKNDSLVTVDNSAKPRKYYNFGNLLLGFTHGKYEKESSLPMLMAVECKEYWSTTEYREWHLGHLHRKRNILYNFVQSKSQLLNEDLGVMVRYLSSLTGTEQWHFKNGYVGNIKAGEGFIWNNEKGLIGHINANI